MFPPIFSEIVPSEDEHVPALDVMETSEISAFDCDFDSDCVPQKAGASDALRCRPASTKRELPSSSMMKHQLLFNNEQ